MKLTKRFQLDRRDIVYIAAVCVLLCAIALQVIALREIYRPAATFFAGLVLAAFASMIFRFARRLR